MTPSANNMGRFMKARMNSAFAPSRLFHEYGRVIQNWLSPGRASS